MVGSLYKNLREVQGFALSTLSWLVIPIAVIWTVLAFFIGFENAKIVARDKVQAEGDSASGAKY